MHSLLNKPHLRGITLTELAVVIAILSIAVFLTKIGVDFFNNLLRQQSLIQAQRDTQRIIYDIGREIRNSPKVLQVAEQNSNESGTILQLNSLDAGRWGFGPTFNKSGQVTNQQNVNNLFDPVNIGTVTYQYINDGTASYLKRTAVFRAGLSAVTNEKKLLLNIIDDPLQLPTTYQMFCTPDPYYKSRVLVEIHLNPPMSRNPRAIRSYKFEAMRRRSGL